VKLQYTQGKRFFCPDCLFTYFHNPAAAVAGIIFIEQELLLIKRAQDPGKGKFHLPGGFVDPGESAEQALQRELYEELGVKVVTCEYIMSFPNTYVYKGISYSTCDLFYEIKIQSFPGKWDKNEIAEVVLVPPVTIHTLEFAFISVKNALTSYINKNDHTPPHRG